MTLAELLAFPGPDGVKTVLLSFLQRVEFPITDWQPGGVLRTTVELETATISDLIDAISVQVAGGFLESADDEWLTELAHYWYEIDRIPAKVAQQTVTLTCAAPFGPYTITTATVLLASDGARYFPVSGGVLSSAGPLYLTAQAESPGASRGLINRTLPALNGVTVSASNIIIDTPQYGADEETDASLAIRCDARWPSLDISADTADRVTKWAFAASAEVTRSRLDADPVNAGGVVLTLGGTAGAVTAPAVTATRTYVDDRAPITDYITVQNSAPRTITAGGIVIAPVALLAQMRAAADVAWNTFLARAQIGGKVYLSQLIKAVMDTGAIDFPLAQLNGGVGDVFLGSNQVPVPDPGGLALISWQGV